MHFHRFYTAFVHPWWQLKLISRTINMCSLLLHALLTIRFIQQMWFLSVGIVKVKCLCSHSSVVGECVFLSFNAIAGALQLFVLKSNYFVAIYITSKNFDRIHYAIRNPVKWHFILFFLLFFSSSCHE